MKKRIFCVKAAWFAQVLVIPGIVLITTCTAQTPMLYGTTTAGGSDGAGTIFSINLNTDSENILWNFGTGTDGSSPWGSLVYDPANGLFYAMTKDGGTNNDGAIISFNPANDSEKVVWSFGTGSDGQQPYSNLVYNAASGLFYGTTSAGGSDSLGTIFSFDPLHNHESVLSSFKHGNDGNSPEGDLVYDAGTGLYYGMTSGGGAGAGTIFSFNTGTNHEQVLWSFGATGDGYKPLTGSLVYDPANGLYYGMTVWGGDYNDGVIFSFNPVNDSEQVVWNFGAGIDGTYPNNSLIYNASNGLFYGMTEHGGTNTYGGGTIFSFNPDSNTEYVLWNFLGVPSDGVDPLGNLIYDESNGLFYATALSGGTGPSGVVISFNPTTKKDSVLYNFAAVNDGSSPAGSLLLYPPIATGINTIHNAVSLINIYPNPTNNFVNVDITDKSTPYKMALTDICGKTIWDKATNFNNQIVDFSNLPAGMYLLSVRQGDALSTQKIIRE